jgi:hypothetical protein
MVHSSSIKLDCVLMAECNNGAQTYSPVVNMATVCLILLTAQIKELDFRAIDFVLSFQQAELDVDIWMYLPIGF